MATYHIHCTAQFIRLTAAPGVSRLYTVNGVPLSAEVREPRLRKVLGTICHFCSAFPADIADVGFSGFPWRKLSQVAVEGWTTMDQMRKGNYKRMYNNINSNHNIYKKNNGMLTQSNIKILQLNYFLSRSNVFQSFKRIKKIMCYCHQMKLDDHSKYVLIL